MAELTASSVYRGHPGEYTLTIVNLPNTSDSADTYVSGIQGIVSVMACQADAAAASQGSIGAGAAVSDATTGEITVYAGEDNSAITLWIFSRS